jgi:hypothetical protein
LPNLATDRWQWQSSVSDAEKSWLMDDVKSQAAVSCIFIKRTLLQQQQLYRK